MVKVLKKKYIKLNEEDTNVTPQNNTQVQQPVQQQSVNNNQQPAQQQPTQQPQNNQQQQTTQTQQPQQQQLQNNQNTQPQQTPQSQDNNNNQQPAQDDYSKIASNVSTVMVNMIDSLQTTLRDFNNTCPEIDAASKNQQSPINKEAQSVIKAINGFTQGKADANNTNTINAAFQAFGNIASAVNELSKKLQEQVQVQNQQQQQVAQNPVTDSYHYSDFGNLLSEKLNYADMKKLTSAMVGGFEF